QVFQLQQPQDKVSVTAGDTLTLTCTTTGYGPPGPVRWLKGWGSENKTIYDGQTGFSPRVTTLVNGSNNNFSIHIRDVQPEDAGTYYCVKYRRAPGRGLEVFAHGNGTEVSVYAKPSQPVVSGPSRRAMPRESVSFNCTTRGFFPEDIRVRWLKDKAPISAQQPQISPGRTLSSYKLRSTVTLTLQEADVRSQLLCQVQHLTLLAPLNSTYQLGQALRVPPRVRVFTDPKSSIEVNKTVSIICLLEGFYPADVAVSWLENRTEMKVENMSQAEETPEGLFKLRSLLEVQATEQRNGSVFTCRVVHDGQKPVSRMLPLWITVPTK
ncbi:SIRB1 protein, partial [Bucco capensis]|nr:SIRB1 protein [Bucco capensis]